jgi:hypothetical protein
MKKWHLEGIVRSAGRSCVKLEIPNPGQRTLWTAAASGRIKTESFLLRMYRIAKARMTRQA